MYLSRNLNVFIWNFTESTLLLRISSFRLIWDLKDSFLFRTLCTVRYLVRCEKLLFLWFKVLCNFMKCKNRKCPKTFGAVSYLRHLGGNYLKLFLPKRCGYKDLPNWVGRPTFLYIMHIFQNYPGVWWRETLFSWICCRRNIGFAVCSWFLWNSSQLLYLAHPVIVWLTLYRQTHQNRSDSTWLMYWTLTFLRGRQNN